MTTQPPTSWSPPSGTRDFVGAELRRRQHSISRIAAVFESHGFDPLETPAFERVELLTGKYGDDEKLIFKIAGRGAKKDAEPDLALRYDLTVPFARFAASHRDLIARGLRSYRIGPVWRADRPARGRFREFLQCDIDIVGSSSPVADAEVQLAVASALAALGIRDFTIHLNSRRVLAGLVQAYGIPASLGRAFFIAVDKLSKVGVGGVTAELEAKGVDAAGASEVGRDLGSPDRVGAVRARLAGSDEGRLGLQEVERVEQLVRPALPAGRVTFDPFIARGLDYYTGPVFEVFVDDPEALPLSIASGGRYDDLIGSLSGRSAPACGGSLGFERIQMLMDEGSASDPDTDVLVTVWDDAAGVAMMEIASELRRTGIRTEVSLQTGGLGAQLRYATTRGAAVAVIQGPSERQADHVTVKDLGSGAQETGPRESVTRLVRSVLDHRTAPALRDPSRT